MRVIVSALALFAIACSPEPTDAPTTSAEAEARFFDTTADVTAETEWDDKADSTAGPGIRVTVPQPNGSKLKVRPTVIKSKGEKFYTVAATIEITDATGAGINWDSVRLVGKKKIAGITKKINVDVDPRWLDRDASKIEVANYYIPDCEEYSSFLLDLCEFDAIISVKDMKGKESAKTFHVEVKMP